MTATVPVTEPHRYLPIALIDVSPTNPRTHFNEQKLRELAGSIRDAGILQPLLARPRGDRFELVYGERRLRAAKIVGLEEVPVIIKELDDKRALEIQVFENDQREDLHPLDRADGYTRLIRECGYTAESLADALHKSRSYVYSFTKLLDLCDDVRKQLDHGTLSASLALAIARIPDPKLQAAAVRGTGNMSFRVAKEHIRENYMIELAGATWPLDDAELLPKAGACAVCPFNSANQTNMFDDESATKTGAKKKTKSADVCTKPSCFREKQDAQWRKRQVEAKERGLRVMPPAEEKDVFRYGYFDEHNGKYVSVDSSISYDSKRTFRTALGSNLPQITIARDPHTGGTLELIPRKDADQMLVAAGLRSVRAVESNDRYRDSERIAAAKRKLERAIEAAVIAEAEPKLKTLKLSTDLLRVFTKAMCFGNHYRMEEVFKRRDVKWPDYNGRNRAISSFVDGLTDGEMILVAAELLLNFNNLEARAAEQKNLVRQLASMVGIDCDAIDKRMRAEAKQRVEIARKKKAAKVKNAAARAKRTDVHAQATKARKAARS
jgi:ParB/RepB/Spo0J family partition protein